MLANVLFECVGTSISILSLDGRRWERSRMGLPDVEGAGGAKEGNRSSNVYICIERMNLQNYYLQLDIIHKFMFRVLF